MKIGEAKAKAKSKRKRIGLASLFVRDKRITDKAQGIKTDKRRIGDIGEDIACEHLTALGYDIIGRNVQISHKEIDIIAENDEYTVIVEVKSLSKTKKQAETDGIRASDQIDREKALNVISASRAWCTRNYTGRTPRIDVIEVYLGDTPPSVVHIENAINGQMLYRRRR